jgi:hypothetical protein
MMSRHWKFSTHISNFDDIGQCWIFAISFWKWPKFWRRILAPLMVTYHYVKFYVSIIIHLEVININVWNFNFPIGHILLILKPSWFVHIAKNKKNENSFTTICTSYKHPHHMLSSKSPRNLTSTINFWSHSVLVQPHQINFGSPHNLLGAHQAHSASATSIARCPMAGGPLKAPRSPGINGVQFEEQFCVFKIFKMSAIFKMAAKTRHKNGG